MDRNTSHRTVGLATLVILLLAAVLAIPANARASGAIEHKAISGSTSPQGSGGPEATEACAVWTSQAPMECFPTEAELLRNAQGRTRGVAPMAASSLCSTALRLYDGINYGGAVLYIYQRGTWINLSSYGWSNRASSFKVGACNSYLADGSGGGGSWYPTYLSQAWDQSSNMLAWSNRVSSVYLR